MKIKVCDVCLAEGKLVNSKARVGFTGGIKVDLCKEHINWGKQLNKGEFSEKAFKVLMKQDKVLSEINEKNK